MIDCEQNLLKIRDVNQRLVIKLTDSFDEDLECPWKEVVVYLGTTRLLSPYRPAPISSANPAILEGSR
jgi:hypothetical protein